MDWVEMSKVWIEMSDQIEATHRPVHDEMMSRAALAAGERVIDIGFGTGDTVVDAVDAVGPEGHVLGLDIAPPMVAHVESFASGPVNLAVGDAQRFAFEPGQADAVISKFGLMFFEDTGAAFANIRKALRSGGRMVFAAWGPPPGNPWFGLARKAAVARLGPAEAPDPNAPGPMRFGDPQKVLDLLQQAGWQAASVDTLDLKLAPKGSPGDVALSQLRLGPAAIMMRDKGASEADRAAIVEDLTASYEALSEDGAVRVPAVIHFFHAEA